MNTARTPRKTPAAKCPECGKIVKLRACGGDWLNALYVIRHRNQKGELCTGYYTREIKSSEIIEEYLKR